MLLNGALSPGKGKDVPPLCSPAPGTCTSTALQGTGRMVKGSPSCLIFISKLSLFVHFCFQLCLQRLDHLFWVILRSEFFPLYTLSSVHLPPLSQVSSVQSAADLLCLQREREKDFLSMAGMPQFLNCPKATPFIPLNAYTELIEHHLDVWN